MNEVDYGDEEAVKEVIERSLDLEPVFDAVKPILRDVRAGGDSALIKYSRKFDNIDLTRESIKVSGDEIREAYSLVSDSLIKALRHAHRNIEGFHREQFSHIRKSWSMETEEGVSITEEVAALESVGAYVPGGRASYPSTVLMNCIPARIAGVDRVAVASPPPVSPAVLVACDLCNINEVYRVGGVQAVAALAYGTESIKPVDKIVGPGNKFVTAAKLMVYGKVDIDMPAGPSEVVVMADSKADPGFISADLLAQAEHDPDARCILVTDSREVIDEVGKEIEEQVGGLGRREVILQSLRNSCAVLTKDMDEAVEFVNRYAPEHLEVMVDDPEGIVGEIRNAGTIFLGGYAPVSAGDYVSGGNHVLPTGGAARFSSELSVRDFLRSHSIQRISERGLSNLRESIETLSEAESLDAHSKAVQKRF